MSETKLISPMLDGFLMGDPISEHDGVRSCPAMNQETGNKYIVKIISSPASISQIDALLLSGAYTSKEDALAYFEEIANGIHEEVRILEKLAELDGFIAYNDHQMVSMEDGNGFDLYLLGSYKLSLERFFCKDSITHLGALNLGLDLCSALATCRRAGYLYVNLKPGNIYLTTDGGYRIGDLGFMKLDSLKYASLPARYHSSYTPPEISDAYSALNTTLDVYSVGLILYQAFNGGILPDLDTDTPLSPPDFADYEMAEIILKACDPDPEKRFQDPVEMGHALVDYMQRNGAHDTPILPTATSEPVQEEHAPAEDDTSSDGSDVASAENTSEENAAPEMETPAEAGEDTENTELYAEDDFGNLTFLADDAQDETLPGMDDADLDYEQISVEVTDILNQADDLIAHPTPDPVVAPEPIDVPIPPPLSVQEETDETPEEAEIAEESDNEDDVATSMPNEEDSDEASPNGEDSVPPKRKHHWLRNTLLVVLVLATLAVGFFYYKNIYLQWIDSIALEGSETDLTVYVDTQIDEDLLSVVCSDTYGNKISASVDDGKAIFKDLAPDTTYTVKVLIHGFHHLVGDISSTYATPVQTTISQFTAVTGQSDGSVILRFTVEGPDAEQWKITCRAQDEETKEITFTGNVLEISSLTVGKEYSFELEPVDNLFFVGENKVTHTASKLILAEDLIVSSYQNNAATITWSTPATVTVANWTVHCYNDKGYNQTIVTEQPTAIFENINTTDSYTIEVKAAGMSVPQRIYIEPNSVSVTDFKVSSATNQETVLTWVASGSVKTSQWILLYSVDGSPNQEISGTSENSITMEPLIPGAKYCFILKTSEGNATLGGSLNYTTANPEDFSGYGVSKSNIILNMCRTPAYSGWDRYDLDDDDYTTTFSVGEKASFLIRLNCNYNTSHDNIVTQFVIRDASNKVVGIASQSGTWSSMWYRGYGEFDIPTLPDVTGKYTVSIYFNGDLAGSQEFSVTE